MAETDELGTTPPPADGSRQPCPSCDGTGHKLLDDGVNELRCFDCFGSGNQGDGHAALSDPHWPVSDE